ncbi:unnamed protein product, partial [Prorocentrum cordatum]
MPPTLSFEQGIPVYDGTPELLEEHLDRIDTLRVGATEDVGKKTGPLGPRLYNALRDRSAIVMALKAAIQGIGPNRVGKLFDRYFDSSSRRSAEAVGSWLTKQSKIQQEFLGADRTTQSSDDIEAFFLLKLSGLTKAHRSKLPASCGNVYNPKKLTEAIRVQFADLHKAEGRPRHGHDRREGKHERRYAYLADRHDEDEAEPEPDDEHGDDGDYGEGMTDIEDELNKPQEGVETGDEDAEEQLAALSECLVAEQATYIARRDLRELKDHARRSSRPVKLMNNKQETAEDRKKRIEESKKKTRCRVCGALGHWAGDPGCAESDRSLPPRGDRGRFQQRGGKGGGGKSKGRSGGRTQKSFFAVRDDTDDDAEEACFVASVEQDKDKDKKRSMSSEHHWMVDQPPGQSVLGPILASSTAAAAVPVSPTPSPRRNYTDGKGMANVEAPWESSGRQSDTELLKRNQYAIVWKCDCGARTAERYFPTSKKYHHGQNCFNYMSIAESGEQEFEEFAAVAGVIDDQSECDDDEVARLDTMCTSTMHGDQWLERYSAKLNEKYGLCMESHPCKVKYRFGGGERKEAKFRDVLPIGIGGENGEISSNRIPGSPTKMLLSLKTQKALGMVIDLVEGTADFKKLGLSGVKLRRRVLGRLHAVIGEDDGPVLWDAGSHVVCRHGHGDMPVTQQDDLLDGFDYFDPSNQERVFEQLDRDDSWMTIVSWSCGPWGGWSRFQIARGGSLAARVEEKREKARPLLEFSARVVKHCLERGRLVLLENPWASDAWEDPALEEMLMDLETSGRYPLELVEDILLGACEELLERHYEQLAFSAEVQELHDEARRRPMRGGSASVDAAHEYTEESGSYILVTQNAWMDTKFDPRCLSHETQVRLTGDRETVGIDDNGQSIHEQDDWKINPALPMSRRLRRHGRATPKAVKAAGHLWCSVCASLVGPTTSRPTELLVTPYEFNYLIEIDVLDEYPATGIRVSSLNMVCDGTGSQQVTPLRYGGGIATGKEIFEALMSRWVSWAGTPYRFFMDQARNNMAYVREQLIARGVHCELTNVEQHHHLGRCERAGGVWKELWRRVCYDQQLTTEGDVEIGAAETNKAENSTMRRGGFAPVQWVLGRDVRIPGSLVDPVEASRLETHEAILTPGSVMAKQVALRDAARKAYIEVDSDDRMRRAMLAHSRPMRGPWPPGSLVHFYRKQRPAKNQHPAVGRWHGICRVIGQDVPSGDAGRPQGHSIWLNYQGQQILPAPEQLRWATPEEILAWNISGDVANEVGAEHRTRVTYADVRWRPTFPEETKESEEQADAENKQSEKSDTPIMVVPVPEPEPTTLENDHNNELEEKQPSGKEDPDANATDNKGPMVDTEGESSTGEGKMRPPLLGEVDGQKRQISFDADTYWLARRRHLQARHQEELEAKTAIIAEGRNCEAGDRLWTLLLTERSEQIEKADAAKAEGMPVSKTLEKQLGRCKGKPGRRELKEREIPKHLKEALDEAKKKEWSSWCHYDTVEILTAKQ